MVAISLIRRFTKDDEKALQIKSDIHIAKNEISYSNVLLEQSLNNINDISKRSNILLDF